MLLIEGKKITSETRLCKNVFSQGTGLMFRKKPVDKAWIFRFRKPRLIAVTMLFVFFTLDLVFVKDGFVVETKKGLKPFSNFMPKKPADTLIELEPGMIEKHKIKSGQKVKYDS